MNVWRRGAGSDHGNFQTEVPPSHIFWDNQQKVIGITAFDVKDFNTKAHHNWTISISLSELQQMIVAAASGIGEDSHFTSEMKPALTSLLRLATEASRERRDHPNQ